MIEGLSCQVTSIKLMEISRENVAKLKDFLDDGLLIDLCNKASQKLKTMTDLVNNWL